MRLAALALFTILFAGTAQAAEPVLGKWLTKGGKSHVEIYKCGDKLCGKIVWLKDPTNADGSPKLDKENPDPAKQKRKLLGLLILAGFEKDNDAGTYWTGGRIYNPEDGKIYKCYIELEDDGRLKVRGYVGIALLGKTQYWTRVK